MATFPLRFKDGKQKEVVSKMAYLANRSMNAHILFLLDLEIEKYKKQLSKQSKNK